MGPISVRRAAMKFGSVARAVALLAPIGCGDEPSGPTKQDLAKERDALKAEIVTSGLDPHAGHGH